MLAMHVVYHLDGHYIRLSNHLGNGKEVYEYLNQWGTRKLVAWTTTESTIESTNQLDSQLILQTAHNSVARSVIRCENHSPPFLAQRKRQAPFNTSPTFKMSANTPTEEKLINRSAPHSAIAEKKSAKERYLKAKRDLEIAEQVLAREAESHRLVKNVEDELAQAKKLESTLTELIDSIENNKKILDLSPEFIHSILDYPIGAPAQARLVRVLHIMQNPSVPGASELRLKDFLLSMKNVSEEQPLENDSNLQQADIFGASSVGYNPMNMDSYVARNVGINVSSKTKDPDGDVSFTQQRKQASPKVEEGKR